MIGQLNKLVGLMPKIYPSAAQNRDCNSRQRHKTPTEVCQMLSWRTNNSRYSINLKYSHK